jgi:PAS domain S-box-containing protein
MDRSPSRDGKPESLASPLRITALYILVGSLWILLSDEILGFLVRDATAITQIAIFKGWAYVAATGWMLHALIRRAVSRCERSEGEARRSEARYRELVENANSIILRMDCGGRITFLNEFAQRFLGYDAAEILGRSVVGTIVPELDRSGRNLREMVQDIGRHPERYVNNINENMRKDGERVWIAWTNKPIRDERGEIVEILCIGNDVTVHRQSEELLQRYELLAAHSRDIILFMRRDDGRILEANLAACHAYGYSRETMLGLTIHDLRATDKQGATDAQMARADGEGALFETVHRRSDGSTFPVEVSSRGEAIGGVRTLISVVRDITERRQAEAELRAHEERLRLAMEATRQGWFDLNIQTGEIKVSPELLRIIGTEPGGLEVDLDGWIRAIHPEDRQTVLETYRACLEHGDTRAMEYRRQSQADGWTWIRSIGRVVEYAGDGSPLRMIGTHTDISERKRVEDALLESQERFRELAELLPETIFEMDLQGSLLFVNRKGFDLFGYSRQDLEAGLNAFDMLPLEEHPRARRNIQRVLEGERIGLTEYRMLKKDGSIFPVALRSSAKIREGRAVGLRGIVIDMTETKKLEAQLRQAAKMEAVGTLAGGIAHDFNNLLQAIQGYAELLILKRGEGGVEYRELKEICGAARRGGDLTRQLLTFSRKTESRLQPVNLNRALMAVKSLLERTIPRNIRIDLHLGEGLPEVHADASQLEQVLMNLALNARDAMPDGGTLTIETRAFALDADSWRAMPDLAPGRYVQLIVADTGHGMDGATLEHIFDPFFTTKAVGKGTGLGLAMVYGIVHGHHGRILCRSEPGHGTTFEILMPAMER